MIDYVKDILGLASDFNDYDIYIAVICTVAILWIVKMVITCIYDAVLRIFR